ncbi:MAG: DUF1127 domain-containing protein [Kiloniellaceae bacterium]
MIQARCDRLPGPADHAPKATGGFVRMLLGLPVAVFETLLVWQERAAERAHLAALNDHMLKDMGLSRADAVRQSSVPFWRSSEPESAVPFRRDSR